MSSTRGTKSIHRAIDLLEALADHPQGVSLAELSEFLEVPKTSVHRILQALVERGLVHEDSELELYSLGIGLLGLSRTVLAGMELRQQARPILEKLNRKCDETVHLGILDDKAVRVIYIDKIESSQPVRLVSKVGQSVPVHCSALGKSLLSSYSEDELKSLLQSYTFTAFTENTITSFKDFQKQLVEVNQQGYSIDNIEYEDSVVCIASPITNPDGCVIAAVSISAPETRLRQPDIPKVAADVVLAAQEVSELMSLTSLGLS